MAFSLFLGKVRAFSGCGTCLLCSICFFMVLVLVFSEAKGGFGEAAESTATASGGVVSEPKGKVRIFVLYGGYYRYVCL